MPVAVTLSVTLVPSHITALDNGCIVIVVGAFTTKVVLLEVALLQAPVTTT